LNEGGIVAMFTAPWPVPINITGIKREEFLDHLERGSASVSISFWERQWGGLIHDLG